MTLVQAVAREKTLRGLLSSKTKELLSDIEDDIIVFGRFRKHVLRGLFNVLDELILDGYDVSKFLDRLLSLSSNILLARDKIDFLTRLLNLYKKIGKEEIAIRLIDECLSILPEIYDIQEKYDALLMILSSAIKISDSGFVDRILDDAMKFIDSLPIFYRINVFARLGEIIAQYDAGKGDSLINYGREIIDKLDYSYEKAGALIILAKSLLNVSKDKENYRIARNWLTEAFRLIEFLDESEYVLFIARYIGDIYVVSPSKAIQLVSEIINLTRPNEFGFKTLLTALEKLYEVRAEELSERIRKIFLYRLNKVQSMSIDEKLIYLTRLANCDSIVDFYMANYLGKTIFKLLSNRLSRPKSIKIDALLEAIKHYANLDLYNAHIFFTMLVKSIIPTIENSRQLSNVMKIYYEFRFVFPKIILEKTLELYNKIKENGESLISFIPNVLGIIISIDPNYRRYIRETITLLSSLDEIESKVLLIASLAQKLYVKDKAWSNELLDFCIEELSALEHSKMIKIIIKISDLIHNINKNKAKELLKLAIRLLEENPSINNGSELLSIISRKMRENFGDNGWARQLELLANELKSKRNKFFKHP